VGTLLKKKECGQADSSLFSFELLVGERESFLSVELGAFELLVGERERAF